MENVPPSSPSEISGESEHLGVKTTKTCGEAQYSGTKASRREVWSPENGAEIQDLSRTIYSIGMNEAYRNGPDPVEALHDLILEPG